MPQLIIDVGAETLPPLIRSLTVLVAGRRSSTHVLTQARRENLEDEPSPLTIEQVVPLLEARELVSIRVEPDGFPPDGVGTIMVFAPGFDGDSPPIWTMTVEARVTEYDSLVKLLTSIPGVEHVAISVEEGIDYGQERFTPETFPWSSPGLVTASIRTEAAGARRWLTRAGRGFYDPRRVRR
jgi:hypothetical protein